MLTLYNVLDVNIVTFLLECVILLLKVVSWFDSESRSGVIDMKCVGESH